MRKNEAQELFTLFLNFNKLSSEKFKIEQIIEPCILENFPQFGNGKNCIGGILLKSPNDIKYWLMLIDWQKNNGHYLVIFNEKKSKILAEIHRYARDVDGDLLSWKYQPVKSTKNKISNSKRQQYFSKYYSNCLVPLRIPKRGNADATKFFEDIVKFIELRKEADNLT